MSASTRGYGRRRIVACVALVAVLGIAAAGAATAQSIPKPVDPEPGDADTRLHAGGAYYVGSQLFFNDKAPVCASSYELTTVKGSASLSRSSVHGEIRKVSVTEEPDDDCELIFYTQELEPGLYTVVRNYGFAGPTPPVKLPGEPIRLKVPVVEESSDDGDDGSDGDGGDGGTGGVKDAAEEAAEGMKGSADEDTATAVVPDTYGVDAATFDRTSPIPDDIDWNKVFPASLVVEGGVGKPGAVVTVQFTMTNTGNASQAFILEVDDLPDALTIVDRNDSGGTWNQDRWLFQTVDAGAPVKPSLDVRLPNATLLGSGVPRWTVEAHVETEDLIVARGSDDVAAVDNASLCQAIAGTDGVIGDGEVLTAVNAWNDGEPLPSVGLVVGDDQVLAIIRAWREGKDCSGFTLPEPPTVPMDTRNVTQQPTDGLP